MTIFNRSDKPTDATPTGRTPMPDPVLTPTPQPPKPVATAQPLSGLSNGPVGVSLISKAMKITGQLESSENIQIDGEVDGDVRAVSVKVGSNAKVKGTVYGDEVELSGTVDGKIEARKVVLTRTAHMTGDVVHQDIMIESGAFLDGHCKPEFGKTGNKDTLSFKSSAVRDADKTNGVGKVA
jgi:cytoskeletal protein CcmA (bactofilin family)